MGLPERITEAVREHDQPRANEVELRTLGDVVDVANILAGSNWEWLPNVLSPAQLASLERTRQRFASVIVEGEHEAQGLLAALSDSSPA